MNAKCNLFKEEDCQPVRRVLLVTIILVFQRTTFGSHDGIKYNVSVYLCTRYELYLNIKHQNNDHYLSHGIRVN